VGGGAGTAARTDRQHHYHMTPRFVRALHPKPA
jgi:hypothetical protein